MPQKPDKHIKNIIIEYNVGQFEGTFSLVRAVLTAFSLRPFQNDTPFVRSFCRWFYWFQLGNLLLALALELVQMWATARGGRFEDLVLIFRMMPCAGYVLLAVVKSYKLETEREVYRRLMDELRDLWPRGVLPDEEHRLLSRSLRQLHVVVKGYFICTLFLLVIFYQPSLEAYARHLLGAETALQFPFFYWFPFDPYQPGLFGFLLVLQFWHGTAVVCLMFASDMLFCVLLFHVTAQLDLLGCRARRLVPVDADDQLPRGFPLAAHNRVMSEGDRSIERFPTEDWESRHKNDLTEIILRHRTLIRLANDVEDQFSFSLLVNFVNSSITLCFCGFCSVIVEKATSIIYKTFLMTALCQTGLLCWYGQRLLESSEKMSSALYESGWYATSKKIKRSIFIMICRSQKIIRITTYGFSVLSLSTYTAIIKTAWSYFSLILNVYQRKN